MDSRTEFLLQVADARMVQQGHWRVERKIRTIRRGLLDGCERMSTGVKRMVVRRLLIRRWAIVLRQRSARGLRVVVKGIARGRKHRIA